MLLDAKGLILKRGDCLILDDHAVTIKPSSRTLLLGPSGCGKTTLLSVLAGLLKPDAGSVILEGQNLYALSPRARDHLRGRTFGFVFQTLHLLPSLTLQQNVVLAADMADLPQDKARLESILKRLGLSDKANRKPDALSQGESQRVAIARAILNRPKIIVADEPTSALDDLNATAVIDLLIQEASESGAALLIATHDSRIINRFDTIIRLDNPMRKVA